MTRRYSKHPLPPEIKIIGALLMLVVALGFGFIVAGFRSNGYTWFESFGIAAGIGVLLVIGFALSSRFHK